MLVLVASAFAYVCQDVTEPENIPCVGVTPPIACGNYTYNVTNVTSGAQLVSFGNLTVNGNGTFNFTFDFGEGDYGILLCDGTFASMTVGYDAGFKFYYMYFIVFLVAAVLLLVGFAKKNITLTVMAGMLSCVLGISLLSVGYPGLGVFIQNTIGIILLVGGAWLIVGPQLESDELGGF